MELAIKLNIFKNLSDRHRELFWYGLPSLISKGSSFLLLPLYTRVLSPNDFGLISIALIIAGFLRLAVMPAMEGIYIRFGFVEKDRSVISTAMFPTIVRLHLLLACIVIPLLCVPLLWACQTITPTVPSLFIAIAVASISFQSLLAPYYAYLRRSGDIKKLSIFLNANAAITITVIASALLLLKLGPLSLLLGELASGLILAPFSFSLFREGLSTKEEKSQKGEIYKIFLMVGPEAIAFFCFTALDRFLLNFFKGTEEVGIYTAVYQISSLIVAFAIVMNKQWQLFVFRSKDVSISSALKIPIHLLYRRAVALYFLLSLCVANIFYFAWDLFFGPKFQNGKELLPLVVLIGFLRIPHLFFSSVCWAENRKRLLVHTNLGALAVFTALNLLLIPKFGMMGASVASIFTFLFFLIVIQYKRISDLFFDANDIRNALPLIGVAVSCIGCSYFLNLNLIFLPLCIGGLFLLYREGRKYFKVLGSTPAEICAT